MSDFDMSGWTWTVTESQFRPGVYALWASSPDRVLSAWAFRAEHLFDGWRSVSHIVERVILAAHHVPLDAIPPLPTMSRTVDLR